MPSENVIFGLAAEFLTAEELLRAAEQTGAAGYRRAEAFSPFPIAGVPESLGFHKTPIPAIALVGGCIGIATAYFVCWYANVISYPWDVGNRPLNSWPAFMAIVIDAMIAGAFFSALAAMFALNGLPRHNHPLFNVDAFSRATQDRYFLCIESADAQFELSATRSFLITLRPTAIYAVPK